MNIKLPEVIVAEPGNPFKDCKLNREAYALVLTKIIRTYSNGFVLALNNRWGEGKTTFVRMWRVQLGNQGFKTIYFNAWAHDFNQEPLLAILSELKSLEIYEKDRFSPLVKNGLKLTKSLFPVVIGALAEKYVDTKAIKDAFIALSEEASKIFDEEINEYANKKKGLEEFKSALESYVGKLQTKPLIFFIDELDRCNPKYAVELLETIKHFFNVSGIVFVISVDKEQFANSIRGYFGSENINTNEYLRRFFDLEYSIPKPDIFAVVDWMLEKYEFGRIEQSLPYDQLRLFRKLSIKYLQQSNFPIRVIEKLFLQVRLAVATVRPKEAVFVEQLFILVLVKFFDFHLYEKIKSKSLTTIAFHTSINKFIAFNEVVKTEFRLQEIEVKFVFLYSNNFRHETYNQDIIRETTPGNYVLCFTPNFDESENFFYSIGQINDFKRNWMSRYNLEYLIQKIELLDPLQV